MSELLKFKSFEGKELGKSQWLTVTQDMVNQFADATFDHQWIHTDVDRARKVFPDTGTIVHGFYTLSLTAKFTYDVLVAFASSSSDWPALKETTKINYGCNKVRFLSKIPVGKQIRGSLILLSADIKEKYADVVYQVTVEIDGVDKPAMISENIVRYIA